MGEGRLTARALQAHNGAKNNVDRMNEGAGTKRQLIGSVTMRSESSAGKWRRISISSSAESSTCEYRRLTMAYGP